LQQWQHRSVLLKKTKQSIERFNDQAFHKGNISVITAQASMIYSTRVAWLVSMLGSNISNGTRHGLEGRVRQSIFIDPSTKVRSFARLGQVIRVLVPRTRVRA